jgi:hypothetical protein
MYIEKNRGLSSGSPQIAKALVCGIRKMCNWQTLKSGHIAFAKVKISNLRKKA